MSQEVKILLIDDLDGGEADDTVNFALDGVSYEIDLSKHNVDLLRKTLQPYIDAGRKAKGKSRKTTPVKATAAPASKNGTKTGMVPGHSAREIRDWARSNNLDVPEKGRIPQEVADQFTMAHAS